MSLFFSLWHFFQRLSGPVLTWRSWQPWILSFNLSRWSRRGSFFKCLYLFSVFHERQTERERERKKLLQKMALTFPAQITTNIHCHYKREEADVFPPSTQIPSCSYAPTTVGLCNSSSSWADARRILSAIENFFVPQKTWSNQKKWEPTGCYFFFQRYLEAPHLFLSFFFCLCSFLSPPLVVVVDRLAQQPRWKEGEREREKKGSDFRKREREREILVSLWFDRKMERGEINWAEEAAASTQHGKTLFSLSFFFFPDSEEMRCFKPERRNTSQLNRRDYKKRSPFFLAFSSSFLLCK